MSSSNKSKAGRKRCILICIIILAFVIGIGPVIDHVNKKKKDRRTPKPQYSVTSAAASPNAAVAGNLLTADFIFTLKAHNPSKKKTIFYGNTTQVTLDCRRFLQIASSSFPLVGPSLLPPGNDSADIALNLSVQNWPLPDDGTTSCDMILTMTFHAGFHQEEVQSKYRQIVVQCSPLTFTFQTNNFTRDYASCSNL